MTPSAVARRGPAAQPAPRRSRTLPRTWLLVGVVVVLVVGAATAVRASRAPLEPEVWMTGLPEQVVSGSTFSPKVHVRFPDRWPSDHMGGGAMLDRALLGVTARAVPEPRSDTQDDPWTGEEGETIVCSTGLSRATGEYVVLDCEVTVPSPGPWVLTVHVSSPGDPSWDTQTRFEHVAVGP